MKEWKFVGNFYCYHHHHLFALVKEKEEIIQITSQGNGKEISRNYQAYKRGHLSCH